MKADGAVWVVGWCALMDRAAQYRKQAVDAQGFWRKTWFDEARRCVRVAASRRDQPKSY